MASTNNNAADGRRRSRVMQDTNANDQANIRTMAQQLSLSLHKATSSSLASAQ
jgi:hypothetical protein